MTSCDSFLYHIQDCSVILELIFVGITTVGKINFHQCYYIMNIQFMLLTSPCPSFLLQYYEANSQDTRAVPAMLKFLKDRYNLLLDVPLTPGNSQTWSAARWQDLATSIHWLLDNNLSGDEQMLWDFVDHFMRKGSSGMTGMAAQEECPSLPKLLWMLLCTLME